MLSQEQSEVVNNHNTNTCILAGAGSGKTRTIVQLIINDILSGIKPENIIAFTFTKKAADELLTRVLHSLKATNPEIVLDGLFIGTIHSWCLKTLQESDGFINFTPLDELQTYILVSRLYDRLKLNEIYNSYFPKGINEFLQDIEIYYNENLTSDQIPEPVGSGIVLFQQILMRNKLLTFGEMIIQCIRLLQKNGPVENLASLYVDEYQDVNPSQVMLIKSMARPDTKITVVGDDLQCIYNWRGSDVGRILNFQQEFPNSNVFRLNTNYRSERDIVELTKGIVDTIQMRDQLKVLQAAKAKTDHSNTFWLTCASEEQQAKLIADIIEGYIKKGVRLNQIAILLRSVLGSGQPIINELEQRGIAVQCPLMGRGGEFANNFIVPVFKWLTIDQSKPRNEHEEYEVISLGDLIWENARVYTDTDEIKFWDAINRWIDDLDANTSCSYNVRESLYTFLNSVGIYVSKDNPSISVSLGLISQIIRSVEEVHRRRIEGSERKTARGIISECYHALIEFQSTFGESTPLIEEFEGVVVTTVHQSKGLEWPIVLLPELNRYRFPARSRGHGTSFPDNIAARYGTTIEDEKRLFYVAASRAKSKLFLISNPEENRTHSRFLADLSKANVIKPITSLTEDAFTLDVDQSPAIEHSLKIGLADLLMYQECPFQFGLRRIINLQPPVGDELGFGKGLHELIQRRFASEKEWTEKELDEQIEKNIQLPLMSLDAEIKSKNLIRERFINLRDLGLFRQKVITETKVSVFFDDTVIEGQIDGIRENDDNSYNILDWKSTIHESFLNRYSKQIQFYTYGLQHQNKKVREASLIDVGRSSKERKLIEVKVDITEDAIISLTSSLNDSIEGIKNNDFPSKSSLETCSACDMQLLCKYKSNQHD